MAEIPIVAYSTCDSVMKIARFFSSAARQRDRIAIASAVNGNHGGVLRVVIQGLALLGLSVFTGPLGLAAVAISNPSFETGTLNPWIIWTGSASVTPGGHEGQFALSMPPAVNGAVVYQTISGLTPGQNYSFSVWLVASNAASNGAVFSVGGCTQPAGLGMAPTTGWQQLSVPCTPSQSGTVTVNLQEWPGSGTATLVWDELAISPAPPLNGGFETGSIEPWQVWTGTATLGPPRSGQYGLTMQGNPNGAVVYQTIAGLQPGQRYLASAWVQSSGSSSNVPGITLTGCAEGQYWGESASGVSTSWQQLSTTCTVGSSGSIILNLQQFAGSGTANVNWDDITLTPLVPANGGFESDSLAPWAVWSGSASRTAAAHTGNYALSLPGTNSGAVVYQIISDLTPGQTYFVSAWVNASAGASNNAVLSVNGCQESPFQSATAFPTPTWQEITVTCTTTATANMVINLQEWSGSGTATQNWDDITVTPMPPINGGFEGAALTAWNVWTGSASVGTGFARSGNFGLTMTPGYTIVYQTVTGLLPGQTYVVTGWVRASNTANSGAAISLAGASGWQGASLIPGTQWQQITVNYTVGSDGTLTINLVEPSGSPSASLYWDDITITGNTPQSQISALANDPALWSNGNNIDLWSDPWFSSLSPLAPAKEYVYIGGRVVAIENRK